MKTANLCIALTLFLLTSCFSSKDFVAEYDYDYRGNFKKYKTFAFMEDTGTDSIKHIPIINKTIVSRLNSQGFSQQIEQPDILIYYKLFINQIRYRGYIQPDFDNWLSARGLEILKEEKLREEKEKVLEDEEEDEEDRKKGEDYENIKYYENEGMLIIYVIDYKKNKTIWQGYTAANFDVNSPSINLDLTRATYKVMNQFRLVTNNYSYY
ncbi:DUF4136 domain-containing protein [Echinicola vietnamensis]|uniref:DUF4136 domain-containing protein n=1 Tax=Echinicola vietnamensis (strain DSM 17526 / LMG 23754 / KMM 6221) TaxID=926556 RepID=L0G2U1_ECHVK|nr:DUF4136 domain-containing protein [Echinicola vietnamensis]AGA79862.1 hypothetical protein Echvi_3647 [Echinicola vietnamensis DSM 17526]